MLYFLASLFLTLGHGKRVHMERDLRFGNLVEDWKMTGPSDKSTVQQIAFSMKTDPKKRDLLEEFFWQVSDPQNPKYGKYLTAEELNQYISAEDSAIDAVMDFLNQYGIKGTVNPIKTLVFADVEIGTLETMLETEFKHFQSEKYSNSVDRIVRPYTLPENVAQVVALVDGISIFPGIRGVSIRTETQEPETAAATWPNYCPGTNVCNGKITPNITAYIYNSLPLTYNFQVAPGNGVAVAEFQTQKYDEADLVTFGEACNIPTITVQDVNGNGKGSNGGIECMLDLEYISGNGLGIPLEDYFYFQYSLITWANQLVSQGGKGSLVHSVSYGNDEVQQTSTDYMFQCNTAFMSAASLGYTLMFASGDQGVWGRTGPGTTFHPDFPASSPYITAVGGTDFISTSPSLTSYAEECSKDGGGGFSNTFDMPSFQTAAVQSYIAAATAAGNLPAQSFWNASGRAYPDISAEFGLKISYCIVANGKWEGVAGTSASCPTVAHGIGVLNNIQLAAGKPALGYINPWLYQTLAAAPKSFNDITQGQNNEGVGTGFTAMPGWDPCSGVGTPNFQAMAAQLP